MKRQGRCLLIHLFFVPKAVCIKTDGFLENRVNWVLLTAVLSISFGKTIRRENRETKNRSFPFVKLFLVILLASLGFRPPQGPGWPRLFSQQPSQSVPLQCSNSVSDQYCDIRVVLLIDDTGSMRFNDPSSCGTRAPRTWWISWRRSITRSRVDAQALDPTVVLPDIKVAVLHFSHCISTDPQDHCGTDVKYNSGWLPITQKQELYSAIDWLNTQPNYYRVKQYTHFIQPFQAASDLFKDPAADSTNPCVRRMMMLLTDGTPEDIHGPLGEPALGQEMGQVKSILQGFPIAAGEQPVCNRLQDPAQILAAHAALLAGYCRSRRERLAGKLPGWGDEPDGKDRHLHHRRGEQYHPSRLEQPAAV